MQERHSVHARRHLLFRETIVLVCCRKTKRRPEAPWGLLDLSQHKVLWASISTIRHMLSLFCSWVWKEILKTVGPEFNRSNSLCNYSGRVPVFLIACLEAEIQQVASSSSVATSPPDNIIYNIIWQSEDNTSCLWPSRLWLVHEILCHSKSVSF